MIGKIRSFIIGVFALTSLAESSSLFAQSVADRSFVGVGFGISNSHSEVSNPKTYASFSLHYKYEVTDQFHISAQYNYNKMGSQNDPRYDFLKVPTSVTPHFSYENKVHEFAIIPEYDIFNLYDGDKFFTPYVFAGLGFIRYGTPYQKANVTSGGVTSVAHISYGPTYGPGETLPTTKPVMPMGIGLKLALSSNVLLNFAGTLHNTFNADYIDNIYGKDGNKIFHGDYFMTYQLGVSFRLGAGDGDSPFKSIFPPVYSND